MPTQQRPQDLELVAQNQQLDVLDVQPPTRANLRAQQRPEREVKKREGHGRRSSQPSRSRGGDTAVGALHDDAARMILGENARALYRLGS
jgi:hypothetical protein